MSLVGYYNTGLARGVGRVSQDNAKVQKHCWHQTPKYFFVWILEIIFFSASPLCFEYRMLHDNFSSERGTNAESCTQ